VDERRRARLLKNRSPEGSARRKLAEQALQDNAEQLGEEAAASWVRSTYPDARRIFPGKGGKGRPQGSFDQIWERPPGSGDPRYIVIEAKGGGARLGTRKVGAKTVEQGHGDYYRATVEDMEATGLPGGDELADLLRGNAPRSTVRYVKVQAPVKNGADGDVLGDIKISDFDAP
jgi:hypothetical protein